jgi:DNA-binding transcriptional MerR regulator
MDKLYYSISEVSKMVDEEQHILRYWEKEFSEIKPRKNRAGNRVYSSRDLVVIKTVKSLLRQEKLSLKGAKQKIKEYNSEYFDRLMSQPSDEVVVSDTALGSETNSQNSSISFIKDELVELKNLLLDFKKHISKVS